MLLLQFQSNQQADYDGEQSCTFNKGGNDQHSRLDFARSLGLAADSLHGAAANATDAETGTQDSQTGTDTSAHYGQTNSINDLQQQSEKHKTGVWGV